VSAVPGVSARGGVARSSRPRVTWTDLGRRPYGPVLELQRALVAARKSGAGLDRLLLVEHEPVLTLGRRARLEHVLASPEVLAARGIPTFEVERAGDVTYHGPGQLVAYPILDLRGHRRDVRWFTEALLASARGALEAFGIEAHARGGVETGLWIAGADGRVAKIAAMGVRIESWVSYHGLALNVNPAMEHFDLIVPCGLHSVRTISMAEELGWAPALADVRDAFLDAFAPAFGVSLAEGEPLPLPGSPDAAAPRGRFR